MIPLNIYIPTIGNYSQLALNKVYRFGLPRIPGAIYSFEPRWTEESDPNHNFDRFVVVSQNQNIIHFKALPPEPDGSSELMIELNWTIEVEDATTSNSISLNFVDYINLNYIFQANQTSLDFEIDNTLLNYLISNNQKFKIEIFHLEEKIATLDPRTFPSKTPGRPGEDQSMASYLYSYPMTDGYNPMDYSLNLSILELDGSLVTQWSEPLNLNLNPDWVNFTTSATYDGSNHVSSVSFGLDLPFPITEDNIGGSNSNIQLYDLISYPLFNLDWDLTGQHLSSTLDLTNYVSSFTGNKNAVAYLPFSLSLQFWRDQSITFSTYFQIKKDQFYAQPGTTYSLIPGCANQNPTSNPMDPNNYYEYKKYVSYGTVFVPRFLNIDLYGNYGPYYDGPDYLADLYQGLVRKENQNSTTLQVKGVVPIFLYLQPYNNIYYDFPNIDLQVKKNDIPIGTVTAEISGGYFSYVNSTQVFSYDFDFQAEGTYTFEISDADMLKYGLSPTYEPLSFVYDETLTPENFFQGTQVVVVDPTYAPQWVNSANTNVEKMPFWVMTPLFNSNNILTWSSPDGDLDILDQRGNCCLVRGLAGSRRVRVSNTQHDPIDYYLRVKNGAAYAHDYFTNPNKHSLIHSHFSATSQITNQNHLKCSLPNPALNSEGLQPFILNGLRSHRYIFKTGSHMPAATLAKVHVNGDNVEVFSTAILTDSKDMFLVQNDYFAHYQTWDPKVIEVEIIDTGNYNPTYTIVAGIYPDQSFGLSANLNNGTYNISSNDYSGWDPEAVYFWEVTSGPGTIESGQGTPDIRLDLPWIEGYTPFTLALTVTFSSGESNTVSHTSTVHGVLT